MNRFLSFVIGVVFCGVCASIFAVYRNNVQIQRTMNKVVDYAASQEERLDQLEGAWNDAEFIRSVGEGDNPR